MAQDSGQEKTEEATPKRLREARKKGQVPKSRDVTTIVVLICVLAFLAFGVGWIGIQLRELMRASFEVAGTKGPVDGSQLLTVGKASLLTLAKIMLPLGLVAMVSSVVAGFLQVGAIFALDPLKPQFKKLNALEGMKNWFKAQTFIELAKNLAKIIVVFYLAYSTLRGEIATVLRTTNIPIADAAALTGSLIFRFVVKVCLAFLVISVIDFMVQKKQFMKQMRMSKEEVKREYKQDEGDPLIKSQRKHLHREMIFSDVKQAVRTSDAVVTNPVHVAVAIKYDRQEMAAPEIMVRGQRAFAEMIRKVAEEENIPIIRNVPLAWALFDLEEGQEIPEDLYEAVAEILSYVYRLRQAQEKGQRTDNIQYV
jgi:flagellar biosynthetic protein FlhB